MLINVLKLSNTTFAPQTHTRTTSISTQTLSVLIISQQRDPNRTKQGLDMQNFQAYGSSGSSLCNIWTSALEHNTPKVTHTHTRTHKKHFSTGLFKKEWQGVKASYKCAKGHCILFKICCIACQEDDKKVEVDGCRVEGQGAAGSCVEDVFFSK